MNLQSDDGENVAGSSGKETMPAGSSLVKNANPGSTCQETAGHSSQGEFYFPSGRPIPKKNTLHVKMI